jgi:hypothetical protein
MKHQHIRIWLSVDKDISLPLMATTGRYRRLRSYMANMPLFLIRDHFLADGAQHTACICREDTAMTPLLKPHQSALAFFHNFSSFGKVVQQQRIQTARLDVIDEIGDLHFIKLDVQGSELNVLKKRAQKALELRGCTVRGFFYLFVRKPTKL